MAEPDNGNRKSVAFDFNKAAAQAREDFPLETKNVTFIDLSGPDARRNLQAWIESCDPAYLKRQLGRKSMDHFLDSSMGEEGFAMTDPLSGKRLVAGRSEVDPLMYWNTTPSKAAGFLFAHELGHIVVEGGSKGDPMDNSFPKNDEEQWKRVQDTNHSEIAADTFGVLYAMKNGWLESIDEVRQASVWRATGALLNSEVGHFTSPALDFLRIGLENCDVMSLTPREIAAISQRHAEICAPSAPAAGAAVNRLVDITMDHVRYEPDPDEPGFDRMIRTKKTPDELLQGIADAYADKSTSTLVSYAASVALPSIFASGKISIADMNDPVNVTGNEWNALRDALAHHPANPGLLFFNENRSDILTTAPPAQPVSGAQFAFASNRKFTV